MYFFFFNDTATTEIYTLSLHDALPIFLRGLVDGGGDPQADGADLLVGVAPPLELGERLGDHQALRAGRDAERGGLRARQHRRLHREGPRRLSLPSLADPRPQDHARLELRPPRGPLRGG